MHYYAEGILIQYKSGTIIKRKGTLTAGSTTMHLIVQIPQINNASVFNYFKPCRYAPRFVHELEKLQGVNASYAAQQFNDLCHMFGQLRKLNIRLKQTYETSVIKSKEAVNLLTVKDKKRDKRSVFSAIRHMFNIGSYDGQKKLKKTIRNLEEEQITTEGEIIGLKFIIAHQSDKITHLQESAKQVTGILEDMESYFSSLNEEINVQRILTHFKDSMLFDLVTAGLLTNELLQEYSGVVKTQMRAFHLLNRNYLPTDILNPKDLKDILDLLVDKLAVNYPFLRVEQESIDKYYSLDNVHAYVDDNKYYVQIPVLLKLYNHEFKLYELQSFNLPIPNQVTMVMKVLHEPYIAVNVAAGTFLTLKGDWRQDLQCIGKTHIYCDKVLIENTMQDAKSCELAIVQNRTEQIKENCKIALVESKTVFPRIHKIQGNKVLVENPQKLRIYQKCMDSNKRVFLTMETLAEVTLPCFCYLSSEAFTSSLITSDHCITTPELVLYNPMKNLLFVDLLLNTTQQRNRSINLIPNLEMPELIKDFKINDEDAMLDLKTVLHSYKSGYYNSARRTLDRHENMAKSFPILKTIVFFVPLISLIAGGFILYFLVKTKKLGQMVSLLSLPKTVNASLPKENYEIFENSNGYLTIGIVVLIILWMIYLMFKYYKLFMKVRNTVSLPFRECMLAEKPPSWKITLFVSSLDHYCYLFVENILKYPDAIVSQSQDVNLLLTYRSGFCNSYVTLNKGDLKIIVGKESYLLPTSITVPGILDQTVKTILAGSYKVEILIGNGSHFRVMPVSSKTCEQAELMVESTDI